MAAFGGNDSCPNCGARMAADQRYCLSCGHRRGDPRLPFMDAVVFMESMGSPGGAAGTPPPPPPAQSKSSNRMNANAALIAGVATLVLAIGVGFLIGRSGHENSSGGGGEVKVIEVNGGGGGEGTESAATGESNSGTENATKNKGGSETATKEKNTGKATKKAEQNSQEGAHGTTEAVEKVLHSKVPQAKPEAQVGEKCEQGTAGCSSSGEFNGNFFE